jgi:hypothetical protein
MSATDATTHTAQRVGSVRPSQPSCSAQRQQRPNSSLTTSVLSHSPDCSTSAQLRPSPPSLPASFAGQAGATARCLGYDGLPLAVTVGHVDAQPYDVMRRNFLDSTR